MNLPIPELLVTLLFILMIANAYNSKPKKKNRPVNDQITKRTKTREKFITPLRENS